MIPVVEIENGIIIYDDGNYWTFTGEEGKGVSHKLEKFEAPFRPLSVVLKFGGKPLNMEILNALAEKQELEHS